MLESLCETLLNIRTVDSQRVPRSTLVHRMMNHDEHANRNATSPWRTVEKRITLLVEVHTSILQHKKPTLSTNRRDLPRKFQDGWIA